jgi:hypothetical protein
MVAVGVVVVAVAAGAVAVFAKGVGCTVPAVVNVLTLVVALEQNIVELHTTVATDALTGVAAVVA